MIKITCKICGKDFLVSPSKIKYGKKYCSRFCQHKAMMGTHRGKKIQKGQHLSPKTEFKKGQPCPNFKGGHQDKRGYFYLWNPNHPSAQKKGYINRSIIVMEKVIGRYLHNNEIVHHLNGIRNDDRPENLRVMTKEEHARYHTKQRWDTKTFR